MIRCPHRINFRLTVKEFEKYRSMIGHAYGIWNWTDLCKSALEEVYQRREGAKHPLGHVPAEKPLPLVSTAARLTRDRPSDTKIPKKKAYATSDGVVHRRMNKKRPRGVGAARPIKSPSTKGR